MAKLHSSPQLENDRNSYLNQVYQLDVGYPIATGLVLAHTSGLV